MGSPASGPRLEEHVELLERLAPRLLPLAADTGLLVHRAVRAGKRVLLEGAQGALLDVDHGTYPYVTSSNTTAGGAAVGAGIGPTAIDGVLGVVKAYTTRVGNGPLPTEAESPFGERLRELGGEFGAVTGRPRRCGWFDATVVRYAARVNGLTGLAVTKLDVLDTFAEIPVCTGYRLDGESCEEMPAEVEALGRVQAGLRGATRMAAADRRRPPARRPPRRGARLPRPARGVVGGAGALRERGHPAGSDHRGMTDIHRRSSSSAPGPAGSPRRSPRSRPGSPACVLDRRTIVSTIERYPLSMTFFSTPERIEIGGIPFIASHEKPTRRDGLIYYRRVAEHYELDVRPGEDVVDVARERGWSFTVEVPPGARPRSATAPQAVVFATGYYDNPNFLRVPGEDLPHVTHYFLEGHPYWHQRVVVIGAGNSSVDAALECWRAGRHRDAGPLRRGLRPDRQGVGAAGHHQPGEGGKHRGALAVAGPGDHADRRRSRVRGRPAPSSASRPTPCSR